MSLIKNGIQEGKEIIEAGSEQASFQLDILKKKLKIYGIQKKIEMEMAKLGEMLYNFFQSKNRNIQKDKQITDMVESIKELKEEIKKTEQEIIGIQGNFKGAKEKLYTSCKNLFKKIKKGWNPEDKAIVEEADAQPKTPLEQKKPNVEKDQGAKTG